MRCIMNNDAGAQNNAVDQGRALRRNLLEARRRVTRRRKQPLTPSPPGLLSPAPKSPYYVPFCTGPPGKQSNPTRGARQKAAAHKEQPSQWAWGHRQHTGNRAAGDTLPSSQRAWPPPPAGCQATHWNNATAAAAQPLPQQEAATRDLAAARCRGPRATALKRRGLRISRRPRPRLPLSQVVRGRQRLTPSFPRVGWAGQNKRFAGLSQNGKPVNRERTLSKKPHSYKGEEGG